MADTSHLERMGRELKCPICLSLLNCAVSLSCNHVFCNQCIRKLMKSGANCPVCKVPFLRREVRPAPHMDNLVNIYKSMEVASGTNIFVTQNELSTKLSDEGKLAEGNNSTGGASADGAENHVNGQGKRSKQMSKSKPKSSSRNSVIPSYPSNKRVQVPQSPLSETPMRTAMFEPGIAETMNRPNTEAAIECPLPKKDQLLSPFFWLREEDVDKLSQKSDLDPVSGTPVMAPAFSDIKDSDDDISPNLEEAGNSKPNVGNLFDSEMFEWTQRASSPELRSGSTLGSEAEECDDWPMKVSARPSKDAGMKDVIKERPEPIQSKEQNSIGETPLHQNCYPGIKSTDDLINMQSRKRNSKASRGSGSKRMKKNNDHCLRNSAAPNIVKNFVQYKVADTCKNPGSKETKPRKSNLSSSGTNENEATHIPLKSRKSYTECKPKSLGRKFKCKKQLEVPCHKSSTDKLANSNQKNCCNFDADDSSMSIGRANSETRGISCSLTMEKVLETDRVLLKKCKANSIKPSCAFCHTAEETEASGEMVCYLNGKPVSMDYQGESSIIHSHQNCTEWAPDVYFDDDIAVNLEAELARSRRIKCSLCGVKGAALGCYEKTCRKSFHIPCAKKLRECRWDYDHFVILCPIHASSKLPGELKGPQVKRRKYNKGQPLSKAAKHDTDMALRSSQGLLLCFSALTNSEKEAIAEFQKLSGATVSKNWSPRVTHVIASTDVNGACRRTLKVLMGILEGKWVLCIEWIKACIKAKRIVDEGPYEICVDIHGIKDGPRLGRLRLINKQPKLFSGYQFYFTGDFVPSYRGYLQDLVSAAGGTILHRKPIAEVQLPDASVPRTIIVYSLELPDNCDIRKKTMILRCRQSDAEALAKLTGSRVESNMWLLKCIAGYKLQDM